MTSQTPPAVLATREAEAGEPALGILVRDRSPGEGVEPAEVEPALEDRREVLPAAVDGSGQDGAASQLGDQGGGPAHGLAGSAPGSAPRSKRWLASVCMPRPARRHPDLLAVEVGTLDQDVGVPSVTSLSAPPMTPARPTGRSASAITSIPGSSLRSTPSRVTRRLALPRPADNEPAPGQLCQVVGMERLAHLPEDEVGHVDHVVDRDADRSLPDGCGASPGWDRS